MISAANHSDREDWIQCIEPAMSSSFEVGRLFVDVIEARFKYADASGTIPLNRILIFDIYSFQCSRSRPYIVLWFLGWSVWRRGVGKVAAYKGYNIPCAPMVFCSKLSL